VSGALHATSGKTKATAFAPASAANVAIGFDILGFSVDVLGDKVTVGRTDKPGVVISGSSGVV
jgi:homoserine kinase